MGFPTIFIVLTENWRFERISQNKEKKNYSVCSSEQFNKVIKSSLSFRKKKSSRLEISNRTSFQTTDKESTYGLSETLRALVVWHDVECERI